MKPRVRPRRVIIAGAACATVLASYAVPANASSPPAAHYTYAVTASASPTDGSQWGQIAVDTNLHVVNVASRSSFNNYHWDGIDGVARFNGHSLKFIGGTTILHSDDTQNLAVDSITHTAFMLNYYGHVLRGVDEKYGNIVSTIAGFYNPTNVAVDPAAHRIYVSAYGTLYVINEQTNSVIAQIPVLAQAGGNALAINAFTHNVYVASLGRITVVDGATDTITKTIPVGIQTEAVAADPTTHTLYAVDRLGGKLIRINGNTGERDHKWQVGAYPIVVAVDPSIHRAYIAYNYSASISVVNLYTGGVIDTVGTDGVYPSSIAVDPITHSVFAGDTNKIIKISRLTN